jgi:hypothetical protein
MHDGDFLGTSGGEFLLTGDGILIRAGSSDILATYYGCGGTVTLGVIGGHAGNLGVVRVSTRISGGMRCPLVGMRQAARLSIDCGAVPGLAVRILSTPVLVV